MATMRPSFCRFLTISAFLRRQHLGFEVVDAKAPRDLLRSSLVVSSEHDQADSLRFQFAQRLCGVDGLTGSATAMLPAYCPSMAT